LHNSSEQPGVVEGGTSQTLLRISVARLDLFCDKGTFQDMKKILIIVPDGGMLFEAAGIADILMQANRLHPEGLAHPATALLSPPRSRTR
jgi:hypothetical protein